ncbi:hypothetical protein [Pseudoxanthomonas sp. UTMC 1351]|uniref:hypothetical protein n=1 Tax=Pseudoxanthomonas sp. UTMC 1351 TaxID=2695853 RepID=UPI0034CD3584
MRRIVFASLISIAAPALHAAPNCTGNLVQPPLPSRSVAAPVAPEFVANATQLGAPSGVLAHAFDEALSVDRVLLRLRIEGCQNVAKALPAAISAAAAGASSAAAYKPKTEFDNTPWRFDMNQNGKRMTAEEFDAWMKSRGVRVAKGAAPAAVPAAVPVVEKTK